MDVELPVSIARQPDYTTCGPASLHLALHALRRGYEAVTWAPQLTMPTVS